MTVHHLPSPPLADRKAAIAAALSAADLTLDDLLTGPIEHIDSVGPYVGQGELIERIGAVARAIQGPGRVRASVAAEALSFFADALHRVAVDQ